MNKILNFFLSFYESFNIFSSPVELYMDRMNRISSRAGSFLTFVIFAILAFLFATSDMLNHKNPKTLDQMVSSSLSEITLNINNFSPFLAFGEYQWVNDTISQVHIPIDPSYLR